jgi:hypothetical protein
MSLSFDNRLYGYTKKNPQLQTFQDIYYEVLHFFFKHSLLEDIKKYSRPIVPLRIGAFYQISTMDVRRLRTDFFYNINLCFMFPLHKCPIF